MGRIYETAIKIGATISKSFKGDTHGAAAALGKLTAASKKLDAAVSSSKSRYNQASEALARLKAAETAAGGATRESTKWIKAGEKEVAGLAKELDRATAAAQKNAKAIRDLPKQQLAHSRERLFGKKKEHEPLFAEGKEQIKSVGESILHLVEVGAVAGETLHLLAERTIKAGADIGETSEKLGIGAQALQELRYGAQQSGAQIEDLDKALAKMAVTTGKWKNAKGGGAASAVILGGLQMSDLAKAGGAGAGELDPFKRIGLSAKALATLKPDEQLKKIADGMLKLKTHADKAAVAQAIFGKGATQLLPYLSEGSEGIEKLSKAANKYGGVLSDDTVEAAVAAEKASKDMNLAISGVTNTLGAALIPIATKAFKTVSKWALDNRAKIKQWAETSAKWIEEKAIPAIFKIVDAIKSFGAKAIWLVEGTAKLAGGFGNLAIAVGLVRLAPLALTLGKIGIEGFRAADAMLKLGEASKAANAVGSVENVSGLGKALGVAATAQMVIGAAAIGYAIGTALDNWIGASDWFGKLARLDENDKDKAYDAAYRKGVKLKLQHNLSAPTAAPLAELGIDSAQKPIGLVGGDQFAVPTTGGAAGGGGASVTAPVQLVIGSSPMELLQMLEDAQKKQRDFVAKELAKHHAQKRRVSFGH